MLVALASGTRLGRRGMFHMPNGTKEQSERDQAGTAKKAGKHLAPRGAKRRRARPGAHRAR